MLLSVCLHVAATCTSYSSNLKLASPSPDYKRGVELDPEPGSEYVDNAYVC